MRDETDENDSQTLKFLLIFLAFVAFLGLVFAGAIEFAVYIARHLSWR